MGRKVDSVLDGNLQMKIAALAPFPFYQAEFGGGERIYNLLTRIDSEVKVFIANVGAAGSVKDGNLDMEFFALDQEADDYDMLVAKNSLQVFGPALRDYEPDLVILEHPWQVLAIGGQKYLYDAHNNETNMKQAIGKTDIVEQVKDLEKLALRADHVTYCSVDDNLETESPKTWIPNGTDIPETPNLIGKDSKVLLFTGSAHPPNIGAALTLANLAKGLPDYHIVIAGECSRVIQTDLPNVSLLGHVNKQTLDYLFRTAHAFINPIVAGSGTSLKVIKSLSYGLPVISSELGARGYTDACIISRTAQELFSALDELKTPSHYKMVSESSRAFAKGYSWDAVGARFNEVVQSLL